MDSVKETDHLEILDADGMTLKRTLNRYDNR